MGRVVWTITASTMRTNAIDMASKSPTNMSRKSSREACEKSSQRAYEQKTSFGQFNFFKLFWDQDTQVCHLAGHNMVDDRECEPWQASKWHLSTQL